MDKAEAILAVELNAICENGGIKYYAYGNERIKELEKPAREFIILHDLPRADPRKTAGKNTVKRRCANMALVKIGTMALRSPEGEFLPEEPIYREIEEPKKSGEYIPLGELAEIFADKFKAHKAAQRKVHKEGEI